jgi:hypothetical protein
VKNTDASKYPTLNCSGTTKQPWCCVTNRQQENETDGDADLCSEGHDSGVVGENLADLVSYRQQQCTQNDRCRRTCHTYQPPEPHRVKRISISTDDAGDNYSQLYDVLGSCDVAVAKMMPNSSGSSTIQSKPGPTTETLDCVRSAQTRSAKRYSHRRRQHHEYHGHGVMCRNVHTTELGCKQRNCLANGNSSNGQHSTSTHTHSITAEPAFAIPPKGKMPFWESTGQS